MGLTVTHIEKCEGGFRWAIRFTGSNGDFEIMRRRLKYEVIPPAMWSKSYTWRDGKSGAWLIVGHVLYRLRHHFDNLQCNCSSRRESTNIVHLCSFWVPGINNDWTPHLSLEPA